MLNLNERTIAELTYPEYFRRGKKYFEEGRVGGYREADDKIEATVVGSEEYRVSVDLGVLEFDCDCLVFHGKVPCKHVVALLLAKAHGFSERPIGFKPRRKRRLTEVEGGGVERRSSRRGGATGDDLDKVEKKIKSAIRSLDYDAGYWDYVDRQENFADLTLRLVRSLPVEREATEFLLNLTVWLDEKLSEYDDSDGVLQDCLYQILVQVVLYLDGDGPESLKIIYRFTDRDSNSDLPSRIVEAVLNETINAEVRNSLFDKLENYLHGDNENFSFDLEADLMILAEILPEKDPERFEKLAFQYFKTDNHVRLKLIEFYNKRKNFEKALAIGWAERHENLFSEAVLETLRGLNSTEKLLIYYCERVEKEITREDLKILQELYRESGNVSEWEEFLTRLETKKKGFYEAVDYDLFLKRYDRLTDLLLKESHGFEVTNLIEEYARKFSILDKTQAIRLHRFMFEKEAAKLKTSNHYKNIWSLIEKLEAFGDDDYVREKFLLLRSDYPRKVKLLEGLDKFLEKS